MENDDFLKIEIEPALNDLTVELVAFVELAILISAGYYKGDPPCDLAHGCENNGICHNTCGDFWCDCPVPYTNGKRCEGCKY